MIKKRFDRSGQVWVETVIYILIALMMIGAVLAFAQPKIQEIQDKLVLEKTFEVLEEVDKQILSVSQGGAGNKRVISLDLKKGGLEIDPTNNWITFTLKESRSTYSEPNDEGVFIEMGNIEVNTEKIGKVNTVRLRLNYKAGEGMYEYDLIPEGTPLKLTRSPSPYKLSIENKGLNIYDKTQIQIEQIT